MLDRIVYYIDDNFKIVESNYTHFILQFVEYVESGERKYFLKYDQLWTRNPKGDESFMVSRHDTPEEAMLAFVEILEDARAACRTRDNRCFKMQKHAEDALIKTLGGVGAVVMVNEKFVDCDRHESWPEVKAGADEALFVAPLSSFGMWRACYEVKKGADIFVYFVAEGS